MLEPIIKDRMMSYFTPNNFLAKSSTELGEEDPVKLNLCQSWSIGVELLMMASTLM